jgi:hypothetical protein
MDDRTSRRLVAVSGGGGLSRLLVVQLDRAGRADDALVLASLLLCEAAASKGGAEGAVLCSEARTQPLQTLAPVRHVAALAHGCLHHTGAIRDPICGLGGRHVEQVLNGEVGNRPEAQPVGAHGVVESDGLVREGEHLVDEVGVANVAIVDDRMQRPIRTGKADGVARTLCTRLCAPQRAPLLARALGVAVVEPVQQLEQLRLGDA